MCQVARIFYQLLECFRVNYETLYSLIASFIASETDFCTVHINKIFGMEHWSSDSVVSVHKVNKKFGRLITRNKRGCN
jgi:hypothetical protein